MKQSNLIIILGMLIVIYFLYLYFSKFKEMRYVESMIDNQTYLIREGENRSQKYLKDSANTLAKIHKRVEKLIKHLDNNFSKEKYFFITKLKENYHNGMLSEAAIDERYTTYTVDKQHMHICLRTRDENEHIYDLNLLMYVVLHELAHVANYNKRGFPIQGHGIEFKRIFQFLVEEAIKIGIYRFEDYRQNPQEYCGIEINSTITH